MAMRFIIISGAAGGGKSVALHALEDLGYYSVDNLPLSLLPALADELGADPQAGVERVAAVVDVRNPKHSLEDFPALVEAVRARGVQPEVVFLDASRDVLIARFSETRRRHPLSEEGIPLQEALERESKLLEPVRAQAELLIDTSRTNVHQLRRLVQERVGRSARDRPSLLLQSFAFKHGAPRDTDMLFDVRCLPNPHWEPGLRGLTGKDEAVRSYLESSPQVNAMRDSLVGFLGQWVPCFEQENRSYLSISVGCTGGRHRSVYIVEALAGALRARYPKLVVRHRELDD